MEQPLALLGGQPAIEKTFTPFNPIGKEEEEAAVGVIRSGVLSQFLGCWHEDFYGGPQVREFEAEAAAFFGVKHAITVNSLTSGLIAAVGAIGLEPGDEVIVSPWTMCATATAILQWNGIPVFADIEDKTFNLDPQAVEHAITPYTRAIIAVDIFGHPANMAELRRIADKHNLKLISDSAQAPGATYGQAHAGTLADIGGFSLNYHKHIHTGEGGILVTDDDQLAERLHLIRNHGEAVVEAKGVSDISNILGFNFRLGEIECAIGRQQLKKLPTILAKRQQLAARLADKLIGLDGLRLPHIEPDCSHAFYVFPLVLDTAKIPVSRARLVQALSAEGIPGLAQGYQNLHLLPMYQQKTAYGSNGFPWRSEICKREVDYAKGICPVAERLHDTELFYFAMCLHEYDERDIDLIAAAFHKVWDNLERLA